MTRLSRLPSTVAWRIALLMLVVAAPALAQPRGRGDGSPRYDPATEATVTGTVTSVEQVAGPGRRGRFGLGGTHLTLQAGAERVEVHLGPTVFLDEQKITVSSGDELTVTGSRVTVDGERVLIAREVKKGDASWTLRDAAGLPLWRRAGRQ